MTTRRCCAGTLDYATVVVLVGVLGVVVPPELPQAASRKSSVQPMKEYNSWFKRGLYIGCCSSHYKNSVCSDYLNDVCQYSIRAMK